MTCELSSSREEVGRAIYFCENSSYRGGRSGAPIYLCKILLAVIAGRDRAHHLLLCYGLPSWSIEIYGAASFRLQELTRTSQSGRLVLVYLA